MPIMVCTRSNLVSTIFILHLAFCFGACSSPTGKSQKQKSGSTATSRIENLDPYEQMRLEALEKYRKMRERMWDQYKQKPVGKGGIHKKIVKQKQPSKSINPKDKNNTEIPSPPLNDSEGLIGLEQTEEMEFDPDLQLPDGDPSPLVDGHEMEVNTVEETLPEKPALSPEQEERKKMISEQLVNYECIKKRLSDKLCQEMATVAYQSCEEHINISDSIDCLKKKLKNLR